VTSMSLAARGAFPPFVTSSRWSTSWDALRSSAHRRNGSVSGVPKLRNREAVTLAMAWVGAAGARAFPLWYQFAAAAYGWNPPRRDALVTSLKRSESWYPDSVTRDLWNVTQSLAGSMDAERVPSPRLDLVPAFADPVVVARVGAALREDGSVGASTPTGLCRDDVTEKTRAPELECVSSSGKRSKPRYRNGLPYCPKGSKLEAKCPPGSTPIEVNHGSLSFGFLIPFALILAAFGLFGDDNVRRSRRLRE